MRPLHSKRKRTTLTDAKQFAVGNANFGINSSDYLSDLERRHIVDEATKQLEDVTRAHFPRTSNLEYAILKAHLIMEFALTQVIKCSSPMLVRSESLRFSFSQKLEIAILLGLGNGCPTTVPSMELINRMRNQVAHRFSFDRALLQDLITINSDDINAASLSDGQLVRGLRYFCEFSCGQMAGHLRAGILLSKK